jgi:hypothetical protein
MLLLAVLRRLLVQCGDEQLVHPGHTEGHQLREPSNILPHMRCWRVLLPTGTPSA